VPQLQLLLHTSPTGIGWVVSSYLIAASAGVGLIGRLGDDFGRRRTILAALVLFTAGCVVGTVATSLPLMVLGRVMQGTGGGGVYPLAFGILRDGVPAERRAQAVGLTAATLGIGGGLGPLLGGLLTDGAGVRWVFIVPALLGVLALASVAGVVPRIGVHRERVRIDFLGALLLPAAVVAPLLGVSEANHWGFGSARTLALLGAGVVLFGLFALVERRVAQPLVNLKTIAHPVVLKTNIAAVGYSVYAFGTLIGLTLLAQQHGGIGYGLSPTAAGLILLPHGLGNLFGAMAAPRMSMRRSRVTPLVAGQIVALAGLALFIPFVAVRALALVMSAATGFGVGLSLAATTNNVISSVPPAETATAASITTTVRNIGGAAGAQIVIALFAIRLLPGGQGFARGGYELGFGLLALAATSSLVLSLRVPELDR
jgi:predicted MFS family arabinose efflux permease